MELDLVFDTETTGLVNYKLPMEPQHQPAMTQIAALLIDISGREVLRFNTLIKPDGWTIPPEVVALNGHTTEECEKHGMPLIQAMAIFNFLKAFARVRVAHNIGFDKVILALSAKRCGIEHNSDGLESFCTMKESVDICQLPPTDKMMAANMKTFKKPNLQEAYTHFFGKPFDKAHDAMADVVACKDVYLCLKGMGK